MAGIPFGSALSEILPTSMRDVFVHPTAVVDPGSRIGPRTKIWHFTHVQSGARIGSDCVLGQGVYVGEGVQIGKCVKIQNNVSVFHGVRIEDGVFVGPHVCFTNDKYPRAINEDGSAKAGKDWIVESTVVKFGASLGAGATILCGLKIGRWALVAAGALVVSDIPDHGLVTGLPGRLVGYACICARKLVEDGRHLVCPHCRRRYVRGKRLRLLPG
jgi:UDP-2-acetamido-3-amino-2,3-dideoxy-glucuronate N-acetyltransferase